MKFNNTYQTLTSGNILISIIIFFASAFVFGQQANHIVISEVYGGGGNSGSTYKNDFIELYNPTSSPINVTGWSVQYSSSTGSAWQVTNLTGTIQSHGFFLIQEAQGSGGSVNLPAPDVTGTLSLSSSSGKVALVNNTTALSGSNPAGSSVIDKVGFGSANGYEGSGPAPAPSNTASIERKANSTSTSASMGTAGVDEFEGNGYDSDDNANDFITRAPQPQNTFSPLEPTVNTGGNGTGTVSIFPTGVTVSDTAGISLIVKGDGTNTLEKVIVIFPAGWTWSKNITDIILSGTASASASININADTITIGSVAITSTDSLVLKVSNVIAPGSEGTSIFIVKTSVAGGTPAFVSPLPKIQVTKVIPIVQLHINDSNGVPASPFQIGATVTVNGIITADFNSSSTDVYVQDATGGIDIYYPSRLYDYMIGDSITVTGTIKQFRGLTEISPDSSLFILHSRGNKLPDPLVLTANEVNLTFHSDDFTEPNEGKLVIIKNVRFNSSNETITDETGTTGAYIGTIANPNGTFDLVGIIKQYKPGTSVSAPYTADYEIDPRSASDIIVSSGPAYLTKPLEENILPNSVTLSFKTSTASQVTVKYGTTTAYNDSIVVSTADSVHNIIVGGLWPATVYHYIVEAKDISGTNYTGDQIFSTASPSGTTGTMNVFFNHSVDTSVSAGENAQDINIYQEFRSRISSAKYSIDLALYSLSGTVGANIANALISAKNRGVKVRVIGEYDNSGTAPWSTLKNAGIPVIFDNYDALNAGAGLMHNKFAVFDFRDTSSITDDWVWAGSWNATDPGNNNDAQNIIEIQDKSLANAYTIEFNEMWGSGNDTPDAANSRFGIRKTDNTPHRFNIAGTPVELYFDPSDQTTSHISDVLNAAVSSINVAMLTFTRSDLAQILVNKKNSGEKVHAILDNNTDTGNQFSFMKNSGVDVLLKGQAITGLLHHKYAVIDADRNSADQVVITGSHNWSNSAETANNENTLIIHSHRIANLYFQEFKARYIEAGGTDIISDVANYTNTAPAAFALLQNFPNPFNPATKITFSIPKASYVILTIYNLLGQQVQTLVNSNLNSGTYTVNFNTSSANGGLSSGIYFYRMQAGSFVDTKKLILLK